MTLLLAITNIKTEILDELQFWYSTVEIKTNKVYKVYN